MKHFGASLKGAIASRGPLCIGIDPHSSLLTGWGLTDDADGLARFAETVIAAFGDRLAVAKPQSAFFERHGSRGIAVLESTIRQLRDTGVLVLLDAKRGDIGSTMDAYADAYLDPSSTLYVDAITVSPYLGFGSVRPMIDKALIHGCGVFVLARTSNPEGDSVQRAATPGGGTVAQLILDEISQVNAGVEPLGSVGAVIGATIDASDVDLTRVNAPILVPGLGTQGGTPDRLRGLLAAGGSGSVPTLLPSYSREVLAAGPEVASLRAAAARAADACEAVLGRE